MLRLRPEDRVRAQQTSSVCVRSQGRRVHHTAQAAGGAKGTFPGSPCNPPRWQAWFGRSSHKREWLFPHATQNAGARNRIKIAKPLNINGLSLCKRVGTRTAIVPA